MKDEQSWLQQQRGGHDGAGFQESSNVELQAAGDPGNVLVIVEGEENEERKCYIAGETPGRVCIAPCPPHTLSPLRRRTAFRSWICQNMGHGENPVRGFRPKGPNPPGAAAMWQQGAREQCEVALGKVPNPAWG